MGWISAIVLTLSSRRGLAALLFLSSLAWSLSTEELRLPVIRVEAPGFSESQLPMVAGALGIAVGRRLNLRGINDGLKRLNNSDAYRDLGVSAEPVMSPKPGLVVHIEGAPIRKIGEVEVTGVDSEIVDDAGTLKLLVSGRQANPRTLNLARERLKEVLENRGYYFAEIRVEAGPGSVPQTENIRLSVNQGEPTRLSEIAINGVDRDMESTLRGLFKIKPGAVLDRRAIDESTRAVEEYFAANQFLTSTIQPPVFQFAEDRRSARLVVQVQVGSRFQFLFNGNTVFDAQALRGWMERDTLSQSDASSKIALKFEEKYREVGYHFVQVDVTIQNQVRERVVLVKFDIKEGPKVLIDAVEFDGVWDSAAGQADRIFFKNAPGVVQRRVYWEKGLEDAGKNFVIALKRLGFLNAALVGPRVVFSEDKKGARLFYDLQLGSKYLISAIHFSGVNQIRSQDLLTILPFSKGDSADEALIQSGVERIRDRYLTDGFLDVEVTVEQGTGPSLGERRDGIEVRYQVKEGNFYTVGQFTIEGNHRTQEKVIRREVLLKSGDRFDPFKLKATEDAVSVLGLFSRVESVTTSSPDKPLVRDVRLLVSEVKPGFGEVGLGAFYEDPRLRVKTFVGLGYKNLFGLNQTATLRTEVRIPISRRKELIPFVEYAAVLGYRAPYLAELPFTFAATLGMDSFEVQSTTSESILQTRARIEERIEKRFSRSLMGTYRLHRLERIRTETFKLNNFNNEAEDDIVNVIGSTGPGLILDFRNDVFNPTSGSYHSLDFEFAHPYLLSNQGLSFIMGIFKNSVYIPLSDTFNFALFGGFGFAHALLDKPVPEARLATELALGGQGSIRGYSLGRFRAGKEVNDTAYLNARAELTMAVYGNLGLAFFFDTGQLFPEWHPQSRYDGIGLGLRYKTPVGPVVIDLAHGLTNGIEDTQFKFYFTVGSI